MRLPIAMPRPVTRRSSIFAFLGFMLVTWSAALLGGLASRSSGQMYAVMGKPFWAPPAWLFGPVWTGLYGLMAVAVWRVWRKRTEMPVAGACIGYLAHLIFQAAWSWLFFAQGRADWAMADILALWWMILWLTIAFRRIDKPAGLMMWPYLVWVTFAVLLNAVLWSLNGSVLPR